MGGAEKTVDDLIHRAKLIADLEAFKMSLGDIIFVWLVDRVIELIRRQPGVEVDP